jgi:lysophospholipase L1-like esterase
MTQALLCHEYCSGRMKRGYRIQPFFVACIYQQDGGRNHPTEACIYTEHRGMIHSATVQHIVQQLTPVLKALVQQLTPVLKALVQQLTPVLKALGNSRKLVLTPLARYWVGPCCGDPTHTVNYRMAGFLPRHGDAIASLRDSIRDALFVKKVPNFRVICPNRMIGVGQRRQEPTDEEAAKAAALWGSDPVHPTSAAYRQIAESLEEDLKDEDARYTNPTRAAQLKKKPRYDPSLDREGWVSGCSAALARRDNNNSAAMRGRQPTGRGWTTSNRGQRPYFRGRSSGGPQRGPNRGGIFRKFSGGRRGRSF